MSARIDLTGQLFGTMKVIDFVKAINTHAVYNCQCQRCGIIKQITATNLKSGNSISCGSCGKKKYSAETEAYICNDLLEGKLKISEICRQYGVKRNVVYRLKKELSC